jgi:hypothetical protein
MHRRFDIIEQPSPPGDSDHDRAAVGQVYGELPA